MKRCNETCFPRVVTIVLSVALVTCLFDTCAVQAEESSDHWAFQRIVRPSVPQLSQGHQSGPVDVFIGARLAASPINQVNRASRDVLLRRLYLNLLGLPPTLRDRAAFLADDSEVAYERLVDRLLASPHYGERWGRHWLDVARYAESQGYDRNVNWPHIWRYRDWVVRSFNDDLPYDDFLLYQLAGDELEEYTDDHLIATAFLATARINADEVSVARQLNDMYVDIVNATSSAVLGLTMACAQCHDHKMEPLSTKDYYRLQAFFQQGMPGDLVLKSSQVPPEFHEAARKRNELTLKIHRRVLDEGIEEEPEPVRNVLRKPVSERSCEEEAVYRLHSASLNIRIAGCNAFRIKKEEKAELDALKKILDDQAANVQQVWGFYSPLTSPHELSVLPMNANFPLIHHEPELASRRFYLLERGDPYSPAEIIKPGFPQVFGYSLPAEEIGDRPRSALARWITSAENPLTARVWVNRVWHYHFGRGLVATPGNFGTHGALPSHPLLLDYLAAELMGNGWSTKKLQRSIVLSDTYRLSAIRDAINTEHDPDNLLYWRWPSRRLEAEALRDTLLATAGRLDPTLGGRTVSLGEETERRSIYLFRRRDEPVESLALFDTPAAMSESCSRRHVSTTALQPLYLLNHQRFLQLASTFGEMIASQVKGDLAERVELTFLQALARPPSDGELKAALDYLNPESSQSVNSQSWPQIVDVEIPVAARMPLHGESVVAWRDQRIGDNQIADDVGQTMVIRRPEYIGESSERINGLPVIRFHAGMDGKGDHFLEAEDSDELDLTDGYAAYVVARYRGDGQGNGVILLKGRNGGNDVGTLGLHRWCASYPKTQGYIGVGQNIDGQWSDRLQSDRTIEDGLACLMEVHWDGKKLELDIFDAMGQINHSETPVTGPIDPGQAGRLGIGGYVDAFSPNGERFHGDLGELLIFRQALTDSQRLAVHRYLCQRWGMDMQSKLPPEDSVDFSADAMARHLSLWLRSDAGLLISDSEINVTRDPGSDIPLVLYNTSPSSAGYDQHTPRPDIARVTYHFDLPVEVAEIEMLVHPDGIIRIEGFVGDAPDELTSIGEATVTGAARNQTFATERSSHIFRFDPDRVWPGTTFRFVVRETVKSDRYGNYQAIPRTADHLRIQSKQRMENAPSHWTLFCQALLNLNEFVYVP